MWPPRPTTSRPLRTASRACSAMWRATSTCPGSGASRSRRCTMQGSPPARCGTSGATRARQAWSTILCSGRGRRIATSWVRSQTLGRAGATRSRARSATRRIRRRAPPIRHARSRLRPERHSTAHRRRGLARSATCAPRLRARSRVRPACNAGRHPAPRPRPPPLRAARRHHRLERSGIARARQPVEPDHDLAPVHHAHPRAAGGPALPRRRPPASAPRPPRDLATDRVTPRWTRAKHRVSDHGRERPAAARGGPARNIPFQIAAVNGFTTPIRNRWVQSKPARRGGGGQALPMRAMASRPRRSSSASSTSSMCWPIDHVMPKGSFRLP